MYHIRESIHCGQLVKCAQFDRIHDMIRNEARLWQKLRDHTNLWIISHNVFSWFRLKYYKIWCQYATLLLLKFKTEQLLVHDIQNMTFKTLLVRLQYCMTAKCNRALKSIYNKVFDIRKQKFLSKYNEDSQITIQNYNHLQ